MGFAPRRERLGRAAHRADGNHHRLDYQQALPFTCLQIDKAFVQPMNQSERSLQSISAALALARSIGMRKTSEGIEDAPTGAQLSPLAAPKP